MELKHLGDSKSSYAVETDKFDPTLLDIIERKPIREEWGIKGHEFVGYDVWHAYETTFLTEKGVPVAGTLKIVVPAFTTHIVESKSLKLYLNSFDMCKMGTTVKEATENFEQQVAWDLGKILCCTIHVHFFTDKTVTRNVFGLYTDLYDIVDPDTFEVTDYKSETNHLKWVEQANASQNIEVYSNVLRSRCRHTKQKDTGTAFIKLRAEGGYIQMRTILQQIISLREQNEFHEPCCEKLFCDIRKISGVKELMVALLYARRGGIDINPVRVTSSNFLPKFFGNENILVSKTFGQ